MSLTASSRDACRGITKPFPVERLFIYNRDVVIGSYQPGHMGGCGGNARNSRCCADDVIGGE